MSRMLFFMSVFLTAIAASHVVKASPQPLAFELCKLKDSSGRVLRKAHCATMDVPENYDDPKSAKIPLFVVKFKARKKSTRRDPILLVAGGPGQAASEAFIWPDNAFGKLRDERDIYLIDQRGTGRSNPMTCDSDISHTKVDLAEIKRQAQVCLDELPGDPRFYTTSVAVKDFEAVRERLDVHQWNIYGGSYGTRVVQHYIRRYPNRIRTAIVDGVVPADLHLGLTIPADSQNALTYLVTRCESSPSCRSRFPHFKTQLTRLLTQLKEKPIAIVFENVNSGKNEEFELTLPFVQGLIRMSIYRDQSAAVLPLIIQEAVVNKNYTMMARISKKIAEKLTKAVSMGMHHSVMCTEDVAHYSNAEMGAARVEPSYMGSEFVDHLMAICSVWPKGVMDSDFKQALESDVPVFAMSGSADPVTPAANGDHLVKTLRQSTHVVVKDHGHIVYEVGCMPTLIAQFINDAHVKNIDEGCLKKQLADPFFININTAGP